MNKIKWISLLLTVVMFLSSFGSILTFGAEEAEEPTESAEETETTSEPEDEEEDIIDYTGYEFHTAQGKLASMQLMYTYRDTNGNARYELYADPYSGEVGIKDLRFTDPDYPQILLTNPYSVASAAASDTVKKQLLSQLVITYLDNEVEKTMYSFVEAAEREQIKIKNIKNGVRVEYTLGRENPSWLVPRVIAVEDFQELCAMIEKSMAEETDPGVIRNNKFYYNKFLSFYMLRDPAATTDEATLSQMYKDYPITKKMAVYVTQSNISEKELSTLQDFIKSFAPEYTQDKLDEDHAVTEYVAQDKSPALFRMALEYTFDDFGLSVTLPASGIRFDETLYKLKSVTVLPYIGAGKKDYTGYLFVPDGSGALIRFEDIKDETNKYSISSKVYGTDYAYHTLTGSSHVETMTMPVFGVMERYEYLQKETGEILEGYGFNRGYFAVITEGDALAEITSESGGSTHPYHSIYPVFYPRPSDTYNLKDSISIVQEDATWTVESSRKYVDNYTLRYVMLSDVDKAAESGVEEYYEASWIGMAQAYRDYLEGEKIINRLTEENTQDSLPLYIESFGTVESTERILSIPMDVHVALTTFDDVKTIYEELSSDGGITNINFRLTGFANGGLYSTIPKNLKWESAVGGSGGFKELLAYAREHQIGIYPDFDFAYVSAGGGGFSLNKHAVKTIDDRYTQLRTYDASMQMFVRTGKMAVSTSAYQYFYDKLSEKYSKYDPNGISVSTLASALNSDFDKKDPYNREDSKYYTTELLKQIAEDYPSVMADTGNIFALPYLDHLLSVPLDSSKYLKASDAVPFVGMVLHGYISFTGDPLNMESDIDYAILKAIENGASLYFMLSYQTENTTVLKESEMLNQYYSVRYDIWKDEVIARYKELNEALGGLQTKLIVDHEFVSGYRVPDEDEVEQDRLQAEQQTAAQKLAQERRAAEERRAALRAQRNALAAQGIYTDPKLLADAYDAAHSTTPTATPETSGNAAASTKLEKYKINTNTIVRVEYEGGVNFFLNYNNFSVVVEVDGTDYTIQPFSFIKIQ